MATPAGSAVSSSRCLGVVLFFSCRGIGLQYPSRNSPVRALRDVTVDLRGGEFVCLVGPSGCGKTSLLKILAGLIEATEGELRTGLERDEDRLERALVFQDHCVFPWMDVRDNVLFGLEWSRRSRAEKLVQVDAMIAKVGLEDFTESFPHQLSVGMRQRVSLARAFVAEPQVLLMDEPLAALDALTKVVLQEELLRIWEERKPLIVYVTHDLAEAAKLADRVVVMSGRPGRILEDLPIEVPRPRDRAEASPALTEIVSHLWEILEADVRRAVTGPSTAEVNR